MSASSGAARHRWARAAAALRLAGFVFARQHRHAAHERERQPDVIVVLLDNSPSVQIAAQRAASRR